MIQMSYSKANNIFGSIQRGLLGNVTPNLRAVYVQIENETTFHLLFYYNNPPTEDEQELASLVDTEVLADFPSPFFKTDFSVLTLSYPNPIPDVGFCMFYRYEKKYLN